MSHRYVCAALALCSIFLVSSASAQIMFSKADCESLIGTTDETTDYEALDGQQADIQALAAIDGPNQTWDFTGLVFGDGETNSADYVALPSSLPASNDPRVADATYAVVVPLSAKHGLDVEVGYYGITDTEHLNFGNYSMFGGMVNDLLYDDPALEHPIPLEYGIDWTGEGSYEVDNGGFNTDVTVSTVGEIDGWGTVTVPGYPPMQALRMNVEKTTTSVTMGIPVVTSFRLISFLTRDGIDVEILIQPPAGGFGDPTYTANYGVQGDGGGGSKAPTEAPDNLSPTSGATVSTTPDLMWDALGNADTYDIQVPTPLDNSTTYYWRVRGVNTGGDGPWSTAITFTTEAAAVVAPATAPTNLMPADQAIDVTTVPAAPPPKPAA